MNATVPAARSSGSGGAPERSVRARIRGAAVALLACGACSGPAIAPPTATLAGTAWQLHAIKSMDDAQGTTRIAEPQRFTIRFEAEGRASLRLDCNRGMGSWQAKPAGDGTGALSFGPIAAMRALCPPPHLDEKIARDLAYVRGYLIKDGKLLMTLMADGGIYEWHPHRD